MVEIPLPVLMFLVAVWPRIYKWLDELDYAQRMGRWRELCPHGALPEENCKGCNP